MNTSLKTLIIRFSSIGDIILASPLLRVLRTKFPQGQIDFVTRKEYAELVRNNHNLNLTYEFDASTGFDGLRALKKRIKQERYDLVIDIHDSLRSKYLRSILGTKHIAVINKRIIERSMLVKFRKNIYKDQVPVADRYIEPVRKFGVENDGKGLELPIPDDVLFRVSGKIASLRLDRFEKTIGLCPGARHGTKRWPRERFAELAIRFVREFDGKVLMFGGGEDKDICSFLADSVQEEAGKERSTDFGGGLSLLETAAAMEYCDVIVTNDTGLMHMATAMRKRVVAVFGSTVQEFGFFPYASGATVIEQAGLDCRPCSHIGLPGCPEGHFRCMMDSTVEQVYEGMLQQLHRSD
ncbi:MAG: lipopolysaccharide heptosyltransferase II [Bacteroidota bacterium]